MSIDPLLIELPPCLDGPRVRLRPYQAGDGPDMHEAVNENVGHLLPWMVWAYKHAKVEDSELVARRARARWEAREDLTMGMWDRESGRYLGGSGLHRMDWDVPSFEIGYWIRKSAEGKGYVTEAVRVLTDFAFDVLHANRVFLRVALDNPRSLAIPPRVGFQQEGILRNAVLDAHGQLHDLVMFGMTPESRPQAAEKPIL
ncbi:MAG: GNAT family N-acetyltransferase [Fimbriimonas sp.]